MNYVLISNETFFIWLFFDVCALSEIIIRRREGEDREAVDRWELGEEDDEEEEENESHNHDDKDARQLQEKILIGLKVSKGREEKRQRFVQFIWLAANEQAMNFQSESYAHSETIVTMWGHWVFLKAKAFRKCWSICFFCTPMKLSFVNIDKYEILYTALPPVHYTAKHVFPDPQGQYAGYIPGIYRLE